MPVLTLTKNYRDAADAMETFVKDAARTEATNERGQNTIAIEGEFQVFDPRELDMWGGHLRFTFIDTEPKDDEDRANRGEIAMWVPSLAQIMTAPTQLLIERHQTVTTVVTTTRRDERGHTLSEDKTETTANEWEDVTEQFHKINQRQDALGW